MLIGIVGKTNVGKTTFFSASTLVHAEISNRIFTTIEPNMGISYVRKECPCRELDEECEPQNSQCFNGTRLIPVKLVDIAGLIKDAHKGKGLGNQFLSDIMEADALIHVVDISGGTGEGGNPVKPGEYDPLKDIRFLPKEIDYWILGILEKNWDGIRRKVKLSGKKLEALIFKQLSGLGISLNDVKETIKKTDLDVSSKEEELFKFVKLIREKSKPIIIVGNKIDIEKSQENYDRIKKSVELIPCSAEAELTLRKAEEKNLIKYIPGNANFEIIKPGELSEPQRKSLEFIRKNVLKKFGSTGIQETINKAVFELLNMIVVYPVENENNWTDGKGRVLPDAYLVKRGTTAKELAFKVHSDIGEKFKGAINARTKRKVSGDYKLEDGDIIKILV